MSHYHLLCAELMPFINKQIITPFPVAMLDGKPVSFSTSYNKVRAKAMQFMSNKSRVRPVAEIRRVDNGRRELRFRAYIDPATNTLAFQEGHNLPSETEPTNPRDGDNS